MDSEHGSSDSVWSNGGGGADRGETHQTSPNEHGAKRSEHMRMFGKAAAAGKQLLSRLSVMGKKTSGAAKAQTGRKGNHERLSERRPSVSRVSPCQDPPSEEAESRILPPPSAPSGSHSSKTSPASPPKSFSSPSDSHMTAFTAAPVSPVTARGRSGMNGSRLASPASPSAIPRPGRGSTSERSSGLRSPEKAESALHQAGTAEVTSPIKGRALKQAERGSMASHVDRIRAAKTPSALPSSPVHHPVGTNMTDRAPRRAPTSPEGPGKTARRGVPGSPPLKVTKVAGRAKHFPRSVASKSTGAANDAGAFAESPSMLPRSVPARSGDEAPGSAAQTTRGPKGAGGGAREAQMVRALQFGQHRREANGQGIEAEDNITVRGVIYNHPFCDTPQDVSGDVADAGADVTAVNPAASSLETLAEVHWQGRDAAKIQVHFGFADHRNEEPDATKEVPGEIGDILHFSSLPEPSNSLSSAPQGALGDAAGTLSAAAASILDEAAAVPPIEDEAAAAPPSAANAAAVPPVAAGAAAISAIASDAAAAPVVAAADRDPDPAAGPPPQMAAKEAEASIPEATDDLTEAELCDPGATATLFEQGQEASDDVLEALDDSKALSRDTPVSIPGDKLQSAARGLPRDAFGDTTNRENDAPAGTPASTSQNARDSSAGRARGTTAKAWDEFEEERSALPLKLEALGLEAGQAVEKKHGWQERKSPAEATGRTSVAPKRKMAVEEQAGHGRMGAGKMDVGGLEALFHHNPLFGSGETLADDDLGAAADARGTDDDAAAYAPATTAGRETGAAARAFGAIGVRRESRPPPRFAGLLSGGNAEDGDGGLPLAWRGIGKETAPFEPAAMRAQAAELEAELAAAKCELQVAEQEEQALKNRVAFMEEKATNLQKLVDENTAAGVDKDGAIEKLKETLAQLDCTYTETTARLSEEHHAKDVLEVEMRVAEERVERMQAAADKNVLALEEETKMKEDALAELETVTATRDAAQKAVEVLTARVDAAIAAEAQLAGLQGDKAVLEAKLQALTIEKDAGIGLLRAAHQRAADLRTSVSSLQQDLDDANQKLTAAKENVFTANEERTAIEARLHVAIQERDEAARAVSAAKNEILALTASRAELQEKYDSLNKQYGSLKKAEQSKVAALEARLKEVRAAQAASEQRATILRAELAQANATWHAERERIGVQRDEAVSAAATLRAEMQRLKGELAAVEKEREVFRETIDGLEERLAESGRTEEAEAAAEREAELEGEKERLEAERDLEQARGQAPGASVKKTIADLKRSIDGLKQKVTQAEREKAEVADQVYKTMSDSAAEQRRLLQEAMAEAARSAAKTAARLNSDLEFAKAKVRRMQETQETLEKENVHLTTAVNHSAAAQEWLAQDTRVRELEAEVDVLKKELKRARGLGTTPAMPTSPASVLTDLDLTQAH